MTVIVGYTPTPQARNALDRAVTEATRRGCRLVVVNSTPGDRYTDPSFATAEDITSIERRLSEAGISFEIRQPVRGKDAAQEVLDAAEDTSAELIVIGMRPRSAVGKLLLGSTAQTILLRAECDVLAVKA
jgi:nucleotide-binding universal stress UspA family protein